MVMYTATLENIKKIEAVVTMTDGTGRFDALKIYPEWAKRVAVRKNNWSATKFYVVAKLGSGLTNAMRVALTAAIKLLKDARGLINSAIRTIEEVLSA